MTPSPTPTATASPPTRERALPGTRAAGWLDKVRTGLQPVTDRVFEPADQVAAAQTRQRLSYEVEAEELLVRTHLPGAGRLVWTALAVVALLLVWAAFAEIDEVTRGEGKVIPSRQLQVVQSFDGGVVAEILVREGQQVEAGQLLLRVDETRAESGVRESAATAFALRARQARLKALAEGTPFEPPAQVEKDAEEARILDEERRLYQARVSELSALVSINEHQLAQREQELAEVRSKRSAAARALESAQEELNKTRPLLSTGAVSEVDILRLERDISRNRGDVEQAAAQIARVQAAIAEARRKIQETELSFRNEARKELSEVLAKLSALSEGAVALADKVNKAQVRSPVRGRVQRLLANTVGGVVQPGKDIVEIVPLDDALVLEARIQPKDIAFIHPDQRATVKLTAYDFSIYGGLEGKVENISPDTQVDERGNAFYVVRVRTDRPNFNDKLPIIPGMTAEVDILTGKKTVLSYLLKPVLRAKQYAFTER